MTFLEAIKKAQSNKTAIGHFNVSTLDGIWAVADAAFQLKLPVIIGLSEGERDYVGVKQAVAIIKSIREERNQDIFLNADHTYSFDKVKEVVDAGFDSVIFDGAQLSLEENISVAKKCVEYARGHKSASGQPILVEGELGFIGTSSKVLDEMPEGVSVSEDDLTKVVDAVKFVEQSGVDMLAPAVGNVHGLIRAGNPALNINRIKELGQALEIPMVLHGASGNTSEDLRNAVKFGMNIVHVNTELRVAYRSGLIKSFSENHDEVAPYKFLKPAKYAMQKVVEEKLKIISN